MRIYLLNPPFFPHFGRSARWQDTGRAGTLYYPIWLAYATAILQMDHKTRLVDSPAWKWNTNDVINDVTKFKPDLVVLDSSFPSLNNDVSMAEIIKQNYVDSRIVLVGPPASQYADEILQNKSIDFVARWEYDFTLKELAGILETNQKFSSVNGIYYKEDQKIVHNQDRRFTSSADLDKIPFVSPIYKEYLNINDYFLGQSLYPEVQIFTGRGCPNRCTFCSWPQTLMGRKYRVRSIQNVIDEMKWIQKNLKIKEVFFEDDTFTINKSRVLEFCKLYKNEDLHIDWSCNARIDTIDSETMNMMKKSNCRLLIVGYESGNDNILKNIKKGINIQQMKFFAQQARKSKLLIHGDFIIGLPGETKETIANTKKLIKELRPDILQVSVASPFPGTEFYQWCNDKGYLLTTDPNEYLDECGHQKPVISYPALSDKEIVEEVNSILKNYYISISYLPLVLNQIFRRNPYDEFKRILYSAKMFIKYAIGK